MAQHANLPHERGNGVVFFKPEASQGDRAAVLKAVGVSFMLGLVAAAAWLSWRLWP